MIWFREMHEQHTMRLDGRVERKTENRESGLEEGTVPGAVVRELGDSAVGLRIACSGRCVTQQRTGQERERVNVEQEGGGGQQ